MSRARANIRRDWITPDEKYVKYQVRHDDNRQHHENNKFRHGAYYHSLRDEIQRHINKVGLDAYIEGFFDKNRE